MSGVVVGIYVASARTLPMTSIEEAHAVPGRGLEGDRYFDGLGTFSKPFPNPDSEVTLVEDERIAAFNRDSAGSLPAAQTRRNVVTRGVDLNNLVGREFTIGSVRFLGHRLCEPCEHLQKLTGQPVLPGLKGSAGLRAQCLSEGVFRTGDPVDPI
jgi:MOSC domain-containing protein YiiM